MFKRKAGSATTVVVLAVSLSACGNGDEGDVAETETISMAIGDPAASAVGITADHFAEQVADRSGGSIEVATYPDGTLFGGDQNAAVNQLSNGSLDCTIISTSVYASFEPMMNAMSLPYLFDDEEQFAEYLQGEPGQELLESLEDQNIQGLEMLPRTPRHITNSVHPIEEISDLEGIAIRVPQNALWTEFFGALGANPTPMDFTELYTALQTGTVDAQENPLEVPVANQFFEVQDYLSLTGHMNEAYVLGCNQELWDALDTEHQEALTGAAQDTLDFRIQANQEEEAEALATMEEEGMSVNEVTPEATEEFQEAADDVYEEFRSLIGDDFFEMTLDYVDR